ncbi:MAG: S1 RNA-binding domain-containing protein [Candidatus Aenigmatarchaeota archaeon]
MIKKKELPQVFEVVVGTVIKINPFSVIVELDEYPGKTGMIHISEVSRKWVKDIKTILKEKQKIIARVLSIDQDNNINLSIKRVSEHEAQEKMKAYKREQKAQKILIEIAKELKMQPEDAYKEIGIKLEENFGEMFKGFQIIFENPELLKRKKIIEDKYLNKIIEISKKFMEKREIELKGKLSISFIAPDGIEKIKQILSEVSNEVEIKYISAPYYLISIKTKNKKIGERKLLSVAEEIVNKVIKSGGEAKFERVE